MALDVTLTPKDITEAIDGSSKVDKLLEGLTDGKEKKDKKKLEEVFENLKSTLSDEMTKLYEKCTGENAQLREESNDIFDRIEKATDEMIGNIGKGKADKIEKSSKEKPKPSDLLKLDKNFSMGYLLLHSDLDRIEKTLDKALKKMGGKSSVGEKVKETAVKTKKNVEQKVSVVGQFVEALASFGPAIKNLLLLNVLKKPAKAGLDVFIGLMRDYSKVCMEFKMNGSLKAMEIMSKAILDLTQGIILFLPAVIKLVFIKAFAKTAELGITAMAGIIKLYLDKVVDKYGYQTTQNKLIKMKENITQLLACVSIMLPVVMIASLIAVLSIPAALGILAMIGIFTLTKLLAKVTGSDFKSYIKMAIGAALISIGFLALGGALFILSKITFEWKQLFSTLGAIGILVGLAIGIGALFTIPFVMMAVAMFGVGFVLIGAGFAMMGVAILSLSAASKALDEVGIPGMMKTLGFMAILITSVALLAPILVTGLIGAAALLPFSLGFAGGMGLMLLGIKALAEVSNTIEESGGVKKLVTSFAIISAIALAMAGLSFIMPMAMSASVMFMPFAIGFAAGMGLFNLGVLALGGVASKIEEVGTKQLVSAFTVVSVIALAMAGLSFIMPMAVASATSFIPFAVGLSIGMGLFNIGIFALGAISNKIQEVGLKNISAAFASVSVIALAMAGLSFIMPMALTSAMEFIPFAAAFDAGMGLFTLGFLALGNVSKSIQEAGGITKVLSVIGSIGAFAATYAALAPILVASNIGGALMIPFALNFSLGLKSIAEGMTYLEDIAGINQANFSKALGNVKFVAKEYGGLVDVARDASKAAKRLNPFFQVFSDQMLSLRVGFSNFIGIYQDLNGRDVTKMASDVRSALNDIMDVFTKESETVTTENVNGFVGFFKKVGENIGNAFKAWRFKSQASLVESVTALISSVGQIFDIMDYVKDKDVDQVTQDATKMMGVLNVALNVVYDTLSLKRIPNRNAQSMKNASNMMADMANMVGDFTGLTENIKIPSTKIFNDMDAYIDAILDKIIGHNAKDLNASRAKGEKKSKYGNGLIGLAEQIKAVSKEERVWENIGTFSVSFGKFIDSIGKLANTDINYSKTLGNISNINSLTNSLTTMSLSLNSNAIGTTSARAEQVVNLEKVVESIGKLSDISINSSNLDTTYNVINKLSDMGKNDGLKALANDLDTVADSLRTMGKGKANDALMALTKLSDKGIDVRISLSNERDITEILGVLKGFRGNKAQGIYVNNMVSMPGADDEITADSVEPEREAYKALEKRGRRG